MQPTKWEQRKLRQITRAEANEYKLINVTAFGDKYPVVIKGIKDTLPPPPPDDVYLYDLKETTKVGDAARSWEWVPVMTPDED